MSSDFYFLVPESFHKLELMFMKHYAPNRCLYIKVAKLGTGVGSAEMSHLQNCSLKIYLKRALGGGGGGSGGPGGGVGLGAQGGCERRIEVLVKIKKKNEGSGGGGRGEYDRRIEVFGKIHPKKKFGGKGVGFGLGGQGGCE